MKYALLLLSLIVSSSTLPKMSLETLAKNFETLTEEEFKKEIDGRKTAAKAFATKKILKLEQLKRLPQLLNYTTLTLTGAGLSIGGLGALAISTYGALVDYALLSKRLDMKGLEQFGYLFFGCIGSLGLAAIIGGGLTCLTGLDKMADYLSVQSFEKMKQKETAHYEKFLQRVNEIE